MVDGRLRGVLPSDQAKMDGQGDSGTGRILHVGDVAPDFQLPALIAGVKKPFRLGEYRGQKNVVLAFYPFNWQEQSARQIAEYQARRESVRAARSEIAAITVDSIMNITAWEREIGPIDFPLCADFWPHGFVAARYGVLQTSGAAERAVFVVDREGRVAFQKTYAGDLVAPIDEFLGILGKLS